MQTFLITYDTSYYNFSGNIARRLGRWYLSASAGGGRSGLTGVSGSTSSTESFTGSVGRRKFAFTGSYAKSDGNSLASGSGLLHHAAAAYRAKRPAGAVWRYELFRYGFCRTLA